MVVDNINPFAPELPLLTTIAHLANTLQSLFGAAADQTARDTGFIQRQRKLSGSTFLQTLVFAFLDEPNATLGDLGDLAHTLEVELSRQGLHQRFTPQAFTFLWSMLQQALQRGLSAVGPVLPLLGRFNGTYVLDSSTISLPATLTSLFPGCGGTAPGDGAAACKVQLCVEVGSGRLEDVVLLDGRTNDLECPLAHAPLPEGALRLADLGFYDLQLLKRYSDEGVFWISRVHPRTVVFGADDRKYKLLEFLQAQRDGPAVDIAVRVGQLQLPARLLAVRVPEEVANRRRQRLRRKASKTGRGVSAAQLALCDWDVVITNVPVEQLTLREVWALRRVRWQVELLFKVWKGQGRVDELGGRKPYRVLCELAAKLLAMIVQHWMLIVLAGSSLRYSHQRGARWVRRMALWVAWALPSLAELCLLLQRLQRQLQRRQIERRRRRPATYQLLLDSADQDFAQGYLP
jgi:hypothetical protein